jgi:hypothetical protein
MTLLKTNKMKVALESLVPHPNYPVWFKEPKIIATKTRISFRVKQNRSYWSKAIPLDIRHVQKR